MRLIDADALAIYLADRFSANGEYPIIDALYRGLKRAIRKAPTIDAVPVVRCKDCEEYIPGLHGKICGRYGSYSGNTKPTDFCSRGVRRMDKEEAACD